MCAEIVFLKIPTKSEISGLTKANNSAAIKTAIVMRAQMETKRLSPERSWNEAFIFGYKLSHIVSPSINTFAHPRRAGLGPGPEVSLVEFRSKDIVTTMSAAKDDLHVIVAGAGLGGLTAALALALQGIKVCLIQQFLRI